MAKKSTAGSILTLIGGILTLVGAGVILLGALLLFFVPTIFINAYRMRIWFNSPNLAGAFMLVFFLLVLLLGIFKIYAARLMKNPKTTLKGGIIALVLGIISFWDILSFIGGIFGIVNGSK